MATSDFTTPSAAIRPTFAHRIATPEFRTAADLRDSVDLLAGHVIAQLDALAQLATYEENRRRADALHAIRFGVEDLQALVAGFVNQTDAA